MEKIEFQNDKYGSTIFEVGDGQIYLRWLFGMPMDQSGHEGPERIRGMVDFDFGAGGVTPEDTSVVGWDKRTDELRVRYEVSSKNLEFLTVWKLDSELGIFSRKDFISNQGTENAVVHRFWPKFVFAAGDYECFVQNSTWCYEDKGGWEALGRSGIFLQNEGGRTTQGGTPFLGLRSKMYERGMAFHIIPKGNWEIRMQRASAGVGPQGSEVSILRLGQSDERFSYCLKPDDLLEMPELLVQALPEGKLYRETANLQKWLNKNDKSPNRCKHKVVYNPWYSCYDHINEEDMLQHAVIAKKIGCEIFEIDAGWYGQGIDWSCCVGDWSEKQEGAFHGRLKAFSDKIRAMGMGFGLWMEPERVAGQAPVYLKHPSWFAKGSSGCYYPKLWEAKPYEYIMGEMIRLIETYQLVWMKIDFNFELEEDETRSQFLHYYESWYKLIDEVKEAHPEVFIEACASGGLRTDINTMRHFDGHFICDNVNPYDGQSMYEQLMIRTSPTKIYQWLAVQKGVDIPAYFREVSDIEKTVIVPSAPGAGFGNYERIELDFLCKLSFRGMVGITGNITTLDPEDLEVIKSYISFYKKFRNHLSKSIVTIDSEPSNIGDRAHWRVMDYYWEKKEEHLIYVYRFGDIRKLHQVKITNIREKGNYLVSRKQGTVELSGRQLKNEGIEVMLLAMYSGEIIHIKPVEG